MMKNLVTLAICIISIMAISPVFAANVNVAVEDFESGTIGNTLDLDGWQGQWGIDPKAFQTSANWGPGPGANVAEITATVGQVYKPFNSANTITDADVDVYLKADLLLTKQAMWVGPHIGGAGGLLGPALGISDWHWDLQLPPDYHNVDGDIYAFYTPYEVVLQMSIDQNDITQSTGTLYYRPLAGGLWTEDSILQNINLGLSATNKPSLWDSFWMRGQFSGGFDNLILGAGIFDVSAPCVPPAGDINGDCKVDFLDFAIMANEWMDCTLPDPNNCL